MYGDLMILKLPIKEATKAYISNQLWLPKEGLAPGGVRVGPLRNALTFTTGTAKGPDGRPMMSQLAMWEETSNHIIVPREFLPHSEYPRYKFPFVDLRPSFGEIDVKDLVVPRTEEQAMAWDALSRNNNGILNLGCGKGKTKLAQKKIAQMRTPTLVVVPDGGVLDQWQKSIYGDDRTPPGLSFKGELGIIQGTTFDWKRPITLALVTTLALKIRDGKIPEELFRYFGLIIYDEVHQMGAPVFSQAAWPFYGDRIGLTATVKREDGLDPIYRYHIGEPFYSDLKQDMIPLIYFQKTPSTFDHTPAKRGSATNISVLRTMLATDLNANITRYWSIKEALDQGRKILVLGHSLKHLILFHEMFPGSGLITGKTPTADRLGILRSNQLTFAIARLGSTGVDDDRLDTLFWLTPAKSLIQMQQSIGRVQRFREGKRQPVVVIFEDFNISPMRGMCTTLKGIFKSWKFPFEVLSPARFERDFPTDVRTAYELTLAELNAVKDESEEEDD